MSCNIDSSKYIEGTLSIKRSDAERLYRKYDHVYGLPEGGPFDHIDIFGDDPDAILEIKSWDWSGNLSGNAYDTSLPDILQHTVGKASLLFTWEGGDSVTGLSVDNGVVTQKKVKVVLED